MRNYLQTIGTSKAVSGSVVLGGVWMRDKTVFCLTRFLNRRRRPSRNVLSITSEAVCGGGTRCGNPFLCCLESTSARILYYGARRGSYFTLQLFSRIMKWGINISTVLFSSLSYDPRYASPNTPSSGESHLFCFSICIHCSHMFV